MLQHGLTQRYTFKLQIQLNNSGGIRLYALNENVNLLFRRLHVFQKLWLSS